MQSGGKSLSSQASSAVRASDTAPTTSNAARSISFRCNTILPGGWKEPIKYSPAARTRIRSWSEKSCVFGVIIKMVPGLKPCESSRLESRIVETINDDGLASRRGARNGKTLMGCNRIKTRWGSRVSYARRGADFFLPRWSISDLSSASSISRMMTALP